MPVQPFSDSQVLNQQPAPVALSEEEAAALRKAKSARSRVNRSNKEFVRKTAEKADKLYLTNKKSIVHKLPAVRKIKHSPDTAKFVSNVEEAARAAREQLGHILKAKDSTYEEPQKQGQAEADAAAARTAFEEFMKHHTAFEDALRKLKKHNKL